MHNVYCRAIQKQQEKWKYKQYNIAVFTDMNWNTRNIRLSSKLIYFIIGWLIRRNEKWNTGTDFFYIGGHTVKKLTTLQGLRDTTPSKLTYCFTSVSLQELHILEAVDCVSKNVSWLWFYSCFQSAICSLRLWLLCSMWQCSGIHSLKSGLYISAFSKPPIFSLSQANPSISVASCSVYKFLHS